MQETIYRAAAGVRKGYRTTERYRRRLLWTCEHFSDLKSVRRTYRCSSGLLHRVLCAADKFHVLRLLTPAIHRALRALSLRKDALPLFRLLRENPRDLIPTWRWQLRCWLAGKPALRELCVAGEALFSLYRARGHGRANRALMRVTDALALSSVPELETLRTTLMPRRREVLAYFLYGLTNACVEGESGKAKLVIRRAYGYKSFRNYRLRLLSCCA